MTLERVRYFQGQLLGVDDLEQEQLYFREKLRRHNRLLHGWGVVGGLDVRPGGAPCHVLVEPGYALDPYGEEIALEGPVDLDLCSENGVPVERPLGEPLYVSVRYAESPARPVPGGPDGDERYSRTREEPALGVLAAPPAAGEPWVVLAAVVLGEGHAVESVDCETPRRRAS